jgi:DNA polymerase-3 subunit gamma/tau
MADETQTKEYRVLARKYRPSTFDELIGQQAMVKTLGNAIDAGRLAHAFIMTGVRGVGKTTTARLIARALNCVGADGKGDITVSPCGKCDNCIAIAESRHVDVLEMDAASRTGVDDIREIIESVRYAPVSARYKVYIIDEVHMLSKNAFNALLKTLEEPPPHVKFIFATTEIRKLPVTVLSRCQRFDLRRVEADELIAHLKRIVKLEECTIDDSALAMIARASEGSVRDSLSLLDQAIAHGGGKVNDAQVRDMLGLADRSKILELMDATLSGKIEDALALFKTQYDLGAEPAIVLKDLAEMTHWLTRLKIVGDAGSDALTSETEKTEGKAMADILPMSALTRAWQMLLKGLAEVQTAPQPHAAAEMVLIRMAYAAELPSPAEVIRDIKSGKISAGTSPAIAPSAAPVGSPSGEQTSSTVTAVSEASTPTTEPAPAPTTVNPPSGPPPSANQGAQVLAMKPNLAAAGDGPQDPMPINYESLVALFEKNKHGIIANYLKDNVQCVSFRPGHVEIYLVGKIPPKMPSEMRGLLREWTSEDWIISLATTKPEGSETLSDVLDARAKLERKDALSDPLVSRIIQAFPDATLTKVSARISTPQIHSESNDEPQG